MNNRQLVKKTIAVLMGAAFLLAGIEFSSGGKNGYAQTSAEEEPAANETTGQKIDRYHQKVGDLISGSAAWADAFFGTEIYTSEVNKTTLRLQLSTFLEEGEDINTRVRFRLRLKLPNTEKRFRFTLASDPDATERVLSEDGWFNTGDIGRITTDGELQLVGRAKDTIVLLGGENIEPAPIEFKLQESRYVLQAIVLGQDRKVLTALIVPDFETMDEVAHGLGVHGEGKALIKDERVNRFFQDEVKTLISAANGFKPFERISRIRLIAKEFRVGEELTHTLKKRRQVIYDRYEKVIEEMYR